MGVCQLCTPDPRGLIASDDLALATFSPADSRSSAAVAPRRHLPDWWAATPAEQTATMALLQTARDRIRAAYPQADLSISFNERAGADQSRHFHFTVTARPEVSAGERALERLLQVALHDGPTRPLGPALADGMADPANHRADLLVSFIMDSGLDVLGGHLDRLLDRGGTARVLTSDYLGVTEQSALRRLHHRTLEHPHAFQARLFRAGTTSFHPKAYLLCGPAGRLRQAFIGSANLSASGVGTGVEWTTEIIDTAGLDAVAAAFTKLWDDPRSQPLTDELVNDYQQAPRPAGNTDVVIAAPPTQPVAPTPVQQEALEALARTRHAGYGAGLVVLATGLGKTWLAAFDSARPQFRRMLFLAHREEILTQTRDVIRRVRPDARIGMVGNGRFEISAQVVLASVQTLTRHLDQVDPAAFDYVVVDEFHHAAATSYRRVVAHLQPQFLLGLTATPDRTDGADLLALCEDNLVYECGLAQGINDGNLVPFHYYGVPDPVDFTPLPWRNARFDPTALEHAVVTSARTQATFDQWAARAGTRTLGFAVSVRHADTLAHAFDGQPHPTTGRPIRAVAVHSGPTSEPRYRALADLEAGRVDIVFSVDMFSEGVDVPAVDTVLLARPTESPIVFLQQLGRGLRRSEAKTYLTVIDFVGNHRTFLTPARILAGLTQGRLATDPQLRRTLEHADLQLPAGCSVDYDLQARDDLLQALPRLGSGRALEAFVSQWNTDHGYRPTAVQAYTAGYNPASARPHWYAAINDQLTDQEQQVADAADTLLAEVSRTSMTKAYKMIALRAWLDASTNASQGLGRVPIEEVGERSRRIITRDPRLLADLDGRDTPDPRTAGQEQWTRYWTKWPLQHLTGQVFTITADGFGLRGQPALPVAGEADESPVQTLARMLHELIDWRLTKYLDLKASKRIQIPIKNTGNRPILLKLPRTRHPEIPTGPTIVIADGRRYEMDFVNIAVNVARLAEPSAQASGNVLPDLLRGWFGPDAGAPGTEQHVELWQEDGEWMLSPVRGSSHDTELAGP